MVYANIARRDGEFFSGTDTSNAAIFTDQSNALYVGLSNSDDCLRIVPGECSVRTKLTCVAGLQIGASGRTASGTFNLASGPTADTWTWRKIMSTGIRGDAIEETVTLNVCGHYIAAVENRASLLHFDVRLHATFTGTTFDELKTFVRHVSREDMHEYLDFAFVLDSDNNLCTYAIIKSADETGAHVVVNMQAAATYAPVALSDTYVTDALGRDGTMTSAIDAALAPGTTFTRFSTDGIVNPLAISPDGNVGIGTVAPGELLHLKSARPRVWLETDGGVENAGFFVRESGSPDVMGLITDVSGVTQGSGRLGMYVTATGASGEPSDPSFEDGGVRLCVDSTGNVGIGTISPMERLHVNGGDMMVTGNGGNVTGSGGSIFFSANAGYAPMASIQGSLTWIGDAGGIEFSTRERTDGSNAVALESRMIITHTGDVGIGTMAPSGKLHVVGNAVVNGALDAGTITGDGSGITDLSATNISSGTLPVSRGGTGVTTSTGTGSVVLNSNPVFGGVITGDGSELTHLNAANISSGTLPVSMGGTGVTTSTGTGSVVLNTDPTFGGTISGTGFQIIQQTGDYGSISVSGDRNGWAGYSINGKFNFMGTNDAYGIYNDLDNEWAILCYRNADVRLHHNGALRLQTQSGGVGITGTLTLGGEVNLNGNERIFRWSGTANDGAARMSLWNANTQNGRKIWFTNSGAVVGSAFVNSSDDRIKNNEEYIRDAMDTVMKLKPQIYQKYGSIAEAVAAAQGDSTITFLLESGLIAQEIFYLVPELRHLVTLPLDADTDVINHHMDAVTSVITDPSIPTTPRTDPDYGPGWGDEPATVNYVGLIPYLIGALKEVNNRLTEKEDEINTLKYRMDEAGL